MANALDRPEKAQFHLVEFAGADPALPLRLTNWDTPIDPLGLNYQSLPAIELDIPVNRGTFTEEAFKIKMKINAITTSMLEPMTRGTPFAPTFLTVTEIIDPARLGDAGNLRVIFKGQVHRSRRHADGKTDLCVLECRNQKSLLDVSMGFQVNGSCVWRLNGVGCTEATHSPSGYATQSIAVTIDGKTVTINDAGLAFDLAGTRSWTRGFLKKNGKTIGIQSYDKTQDGSAAKVFLLTRTPPVEWASGTVEFFPGCSKAPAGDNSCDPTAWDNLEAIGASGWAIPAHNPISENPG